MASFLAALEKELQKMFNSLCSFRRVSMAVSKKGKHLSNEIRDLYWLSDDGVPGTETSEFIVTHVLS